MIPEYTCRTYQDADKGYPIPPWLALLLIAAQIVLCICATMTAALIPREPGERLDVFRPVWWCQHWSSGPHRREDPT